MNEQMLIERFEKEIRRHRQLYYNQQPEIDDETFDELVERLKDIHPNSKVLAEVGAPIEDGRKKVKHDRIMGSLEKCNTAQEAVKWLQQHDVRSIIIQEKLDGASLDARYSNGRLVCLATRGSGTMGLDVTHHADHISDLPKTIEAKGKVHIRGEAIIHLSDFQRLNEELDDDEKAANPRNLAAGSLNSDEPNPERKLRFVACSVIGVSHEAEIEDVAFLVKNKFKPAKTLVIEEAMDMIANMVEDIRNGYIEKNRAALDYMIDGLVLKINSKSKQDQLGMKRGRPVWALAYKFPAEEVETVLNDVEWNLSNTGILAPRAVMKPVQLAGTTVKHAYLHNFDYIKELGLNIGDIVRIKKAGDIIPQIVAKVADGIKGCPIEPPTHCPACETTLEYEGAFIKCDNEECPDKIVGVLKSFIKKLKIDMLGDEALKQFTEAGLLTQPSDLYRLTPKAAEELHGKNGLKIVKNIQNIKTIKLSDLFAAMMITGAGKTSFEEIVKNGFDTVSKLLMMTVEQLCQVPGFQEVKAQKIVHGIRLRKPLIEDLLQFVDVEVPQKIEGVLTGQSFMFTGAMSKSRDEMCKLVEQNGGQVMSVKKGLSYLVAEDPEENSNKLDKARKLGINVISEDAFWQLLEAR